MAAARKNILVADDEFSIAQTLTWMLQEAGYTASFALSGKAALDLVDSNAVDLAGVDVTLPDLEGIKIGVQICKRRPNRKILLMSGDTESFFFAWLGFQLRGHNWLPPDGGNRISLRASKLRVNAMAG